jgi:hypothetical protein
MTGAATIASAATTDCLPNNVGVGASGNTKAKQMAEAASHTTMRRRGLTRRLYNIVRYGMARSSGAAALMDVDNLAVPELDGHVFVLIEELIWKIHSCLRRP